MMMLSWKSREEVTLELVSKKNLVSGVDIGARSSEVLSKIGCSDVFLVDYHSDLSERVVGDKLYWNLENGLPPTLPNVDLAIANDVLEHVENKQRLVDQIFSRASEYVVISLPNFQHLYYALGVFKGKLGKQFVLNCADGVDRHRWVTMYDDNRDWLEEVARRNEFQLVESVDVMTGSKVLGKLLKIIGLHRFLTFNQVFLFRRL